MMLHLHDTVASSGRVTVGDGVRRVTVTLPWFGELNS